MTTYRNGLIDGLEKALAIAVEHSAHVKDNAYRLLQFDGSEQEARCRQLASLYIDEHVWLLRVELNDTRKALNDMRKGATP